MPTTDSTTLESLWSAVEADICACPPPHPIYAADTQNWLRQLRDRCEDVPIEGDPEIAAGTLQKLEQSLIAGGITITYAHPHLGEGYDEATGMYSAKLGLLFVAPREVRNMLGTMLHEATHALCTQIQQPLSEEELEVLAEATSCLFCARLGLNTIPQSAAYLAPYVMMEGTNPRTYNGAIVKLADTIERLMCQ